MPRCRSSSTRSRMGTWRHQHVNAETRGSTGCNRRTSGGRKEEACRPEMCESLPTVGNKDGTTQKGSINCAMHFNTKDLTNRRFGRLCVLGVGGRGTLNVILWQCQCDCGNTHIVRGAELVTGRSKSCGCLRREILRNPRTHGHWCGGNGSSTLNAYASMMGRCSNPKHKFYKDYGGRGITVCERWRTSFLNFLTDMGGRPHGLTLGRKDNNSGYTPANCEWQTWYQQARNKRNNHLITIGDVTKCLAEWASDYGITPTVISHRIRYGWTAVRAVTTPLLR